MVVGVSGIKTGSGTSAAVIVAGIEVNVCGESTGLEEENRVIGGNGVGESTGPGVLTR